MLAIGYADTQPVAQSRNPDGTWNTENLAKNRRVVLRVLMPDVENIPWKVTEGKVGMSPLPAHDGPVPATSTAPATLAPVSEGKMNQ